jgi:hypothetical protein
MAYEKHELLGLNKDGSTPTRGPKTIHKVTEPIAHAHSRDYETISGSGNIARDSTVTKRHTVEAHSGMHRTTGTNLGAPTTSSLLDDERMDISPVVSGGKVGKAVPPVPGQRSRTQANECGPNAPGVAHTVSSAFAGALHSARHDNADQILGGAVQSGSTNLHPANLRRR